MHIKTLACGLAIVLLSACGSSSKNDTPSKTLDIGAETVAFSDSTFPTQPQVAYFNDGNAVAIWFQFSDFTLQTNHYSKDTGWSTAAMLQTNSTGRELYQLASNGLTAIATWGDGANVKASQYDAITQEWSEPTTVAQASNNVAPYIAMNAEGNGVVVWLDGTDLKTSYYTASNSAWSSPVTLDDSDSNISSINVGMDDTGNVIAIWGQDSNVLARRYASEAWGDITTVASTGETYASDIKMKLDDAGNAIAIWTTVESDPITLSFAHYDVGSGWNSAVLLENGNLVHRQMLAMNGDGDAIILWKTHDTESDVLTYISRYFSPENGLGEEETFELDNSYHYQSTLEIDPSGHALLAWQYDYDDENEVEDVAYLFINQYKPSKGWGSSKQLNNIGNAYGDYDPRISFNADGDGMMIFGGDSDNGQGIYSRLYQ